MNPLEQDIKNWLESEKIQNTLDNLSQNYQDHIVEQNYVKISGKQGLKLFGYLKEVLLQSIEDKSFESLPAPHQNALHSSINAIYNINDNINQFITQTQSLFGQVRTFGLEGDIKGLSKFEGTLTDVSSLKRRYRTARKSLAQIETEIKKFEKNFNQGEELLDNVQDTSEKVSEIYNKIFEHNNRIDALVDNIKNFEQEAENSKKEVVSFKENIDSYKRDITEKTEEASEIIQKFNEQRKEVDKLIEDSEKALHLKSSEGISAALSSQYEKEDKGKKRNFWLFGAAIFVLIGLFGVSLFIFDFSSWGLSVSSDHLDSLNGILARIVFVGISITGASFCANQFLHQKKLTDNYAYKLVLAKSIIAFTQEIKKHNPGKATDYILSVLEEINKPPFPSKEEKGSINEKNLNLIERFIKILPTHR